MGKKIPCSRCGALILPMTAERTGGLCMPCKQGNREALEAAKRRNEEQTKYDPHRELWRSLVHRVHKTATGFDGLSTDEKLYYATTRLEGEVYNGGFDQFFWNSSGGFFDEAVAGLEVLGAYQALELLVKAKQIAFRDARPPRDWEKRRALLKSGDTESLTAALDQLDHAFWKDPDQLNDRLSRFAVERGLVTPFLR